MFAEIDMETDTLEISVNADRKSFALTTTSPNGDITTEIPEQSEMVISFECQKTARGKFPMPMMKHALNALKMADKVSLRMDNQQIVCFQYLIECGQGRCFLEYFCTPQIESEIETQCED